MELDLREIVENQNSNGGGLAKNITGKFESNRNALAKLNKEKRSAGDVAKSLRKLGLKITAKEIKPFLEEWHHAGMLPKSYGGGMAKAYYTVKSNSQILHEIHQQTIKDDLREIENKKLKRRVCYGYYWAWESDYSGSFGKKRTFKVTRIYKGNQLEKPAHNFTECNKSKYLQILKFEGEKTFGWDEPNY